jgi:hypothetical protein
MTDFSRRLCATALALCFLLGQSIACYAQVASGIDSGGSAPVNLDLTSTARTPSATNFTGATLVVGGTSRIVSTGATFTPAELVALQQVLSTGQQSIMLGMAGNAVGGSFNLTSYINQQISQLVVPQAVTAVRDFAVGQNFNVAGNLTNAGNIYALSSNAAITNAIISAQNIFNQRGAVLSSVLPASGIAGYNSAVSHLNLALHATNNIVNEGIISSSGSLQMSAGGSITNALSAGVSGAAPVLQALGDINIQTNKLVNAGVISSATGNVNVYQEAIGDLMVDNRGGSLEALNGAINVGSMALTNELVNTGVHGGDLLSKQVNVNSGSGTAIVNVNRMSGELNVSAGALHTIVHQGDMRLGNICLEGDPTFYSLDGSIILGPDLVLTTSGAPLAIVASADILTDGNKTTAINIDTSSSSGGGDILIVAGAELSCPSCAGSENWGIIGGTGTEPNGSTVPDITISGASVNGGRINFTFGGGIDSFTSRGTSGNARGGDVTLVAYQDSGNTDPTKGTINLPDTLTILSGGSGAGHNGNVRVIAGATSPSILTLQPAVRIGNVNTSGGSGDGGKIVITGGTPAFASETVTGNGDISLDPLSTVTIHDSALPAGAIITSHAVGTNPQSFWQESYDSSYSPGQVLPTGIETGELTSTGRFGTLVVAGLAFGASGDLKFVENGNNAFVVTEVQVVAPTIAIMGTDVPGVDFVARAGSGGFTAQALISAGAVSIRATGSGQITLSDGVVATGEHEGLFSTSSVGLSTDSGSIQSGGTISGHLVSLARQTGDLGNSGGRIITNTDLLGISAPTGSAYIQNTPKTGRDLTIRNSCIVSAADGKVMDIDNLSGDIILGETLGESINLAPDATSLPQSEIRLTVHDNNSVIGNIRSPNIPVTALAAKHVVLTADSGDIGTLATDPIFSSAGLVMVVGGGTIDLSTQGSARIAIVNTGSIPETNTTLGVISVGNNGTLRINGALNDDPQDEFRNIHDLRVATTSVIGAGNNSTVSITSAGTLTLAGAINATNSTVNLKAQVINWSGTILAEGASGQINVSPRGNSLTLDSLQGTSNLWSASAINIDMPSGGSLFLQGHQQNFKATSLVSVNGAGATLFVDPSTTFNAEGVLVLTLSHLQNAGAIKSTHSINVLSGSGTGLQVDGGGAIVAGPGESIFMQAFDHALTFSGDQFFNASRTVFDATGSQGEVVISSLATVNVLDSTAVNNRFAISAPSGSDLTIVSVGDDRLTSSGKIELSADTGHSLHFVPGGKHTFTTASIAPEVILSAPGSGGSVVVESQVFYNKKMIVNTPTLSAASKANLKPAGGSAVVLNLASSGPSPNSAGLQISTSKLTNNGVMQLGGAITGGPIVLNSLDLTDPSATAMIKGLILGGVLKTDSTNPLTIDPTTKVATKGTLFLPNTVDLTNLSGFNIPAGVNLIFRDYTAGTPINIHLTAQSPIATIKGSAQFVPFDPSHTAPIAGVINVDTTASTAGNALFIDTTGFVASIGSLNIHVSGGVAGGIALRGLLASTGVLTVFASGNISQGVATHAGLSAPIVSVSSFGSVGSSFQPISTDTTCLIANSLTGSVFLNNTAPVGSAVKIFGNSSAASAFSLTANTKISVDKTIIAPGVFLTAVGRPNLGIDLKENIGSLVGSGSIILVGTGGDLTQTAGKTIFSKSFVQIIGVGNVGSAALPLSMVTPLLKVNTGATGSVFINNTSPVGVDSLQVLESKAGSTAAGTTFQITQNGGTIKINAPLSANKVLLQGTVGSDTGMEIRSTLTSLGTNPAFGITLSATGTGVISRTDAAVPPVLVGNVILNSQNGAIGSDSLPILLGTGKVSVTTGDSVFLKSTGNVIVGASSATGDFKLNSNGTITVSGGVSGSSVTLQTQAGAISTLGPLGITGANVSLLSTTGNIGSKTAPVVTSAGILTASTGVTGASTVFISNFGSTNVALGSAATAFQLINAGGSVTVSGPVLVAKGSILIQTVSGNVNLAGNISAGGTTGSITVIGGTSNNTGAIAQTGVGTLTAPTVNLNNGQLGDIGSSVAPVTTSTPNLNLSSASDSNKIFVSNTGSTLSVKIASPVTKLALATDGALFVPGTIIGANSAGPSSVELTAGGNILVGGAIGATNVILSAGTNSSITQAIHSQLGGANLTLTGGAITLGLGGKNSGNLSFANLTVTSSGSVTIRDSAPVSISASSVDSTFSLASGGAITVDGSVSAGGLSFTTDSFTNNNTVTSTGDILIQSPSGLVLSGVGTLQAQGSITVTALAGDLQVSGVQSLESAAIINALRGATKIDNGASVHNTQDMTVNTAALFNPNGFSVDTPAVLTLNISSPGVSLGTIANSDGDVILTSNMVVNSAGKNLAILASGNVIASGIKAINLASKTGSGGSLTVFAGREFTPLSNDPSAPSGALFTLGDESDSGGSVNFTNVSINTSSTSKVAGKNSGGDVLIVASGTPLNAVVSTGSINTSSTAGVGGKVTLIGAGGVLVGGATGINSAGGAAAGDVTVSGATANVTDVLTSDGFLSSSAVVTANNPVSGSGASVNIAGRINAGSLMGQGGAVKVAGDGPLQLELVNTSGLAGGGEVTLKSLNGAVVVNGDINTAALSRAASSVANGAEGGKVEINVPTFLTINGKVNTAGGSTLGIGNGGNAGSVMLTTSSANNTLGLYEGNIFIKTYVNAQGGSAKTTTGGGTGGKGGIITITAGAMQIKGMLGTASVISSGGKGAAGTGDDANIELSTFAVQSAPENFDLTSKVKSEAALPGGLFTIGTSAANPTVINGTLGAIVSGQNQLNKTTAPTSTADRNDVTGVLLHVTGGSASIHDGAGDRNIFASAANGSGVQTRNFVTPAEAVALHQVSLADDPLTAQTLGLLNGQATGTSPQGIGQPSAIIIKQSQLPLSFKSFVLATGDNTNTVSLKIVGNTPSLDLSHAVNLSIKGQLTFETTGLNIAAVNFGAKPLNLPSGAGISANESLVLIGGARNNWINNGSIQATQIVLAAPGGTLNVLNNSSGQFTIPASVPTGSIVLLSSAPSSTVSFVNNQGNFALPVLFQPMQLPTVFGTVATAMIPGSVKPTAAVTVNFNLTAPGGVAQTAVIGGTIRGIASLSVNGLTNATTKLPTSLHVAAESNFVTATALKLTSGGTVSVDDFSHFDSGALKSPSPSAQLSASQFASKGSIIITSGTATSDGGISIGSSVSMVATGGDLKLIVNRGSSGIELGSDNFFVAHGGNVQFLSSGDIGGVASTNNNFIARGITGSKAAGGIELSAGSTTSKLSTGLTAVPGGAQPTVSGATINQGASPGTVRVNESTGATAADSINLNTSGTHSSTINLNGGAVVFDVAGANNANTIQLDGSGFYTGVERIAYRVGTSSSLTVENDASSSEDIVEIFVEGSDNSRVLTADAQCPNKTTKPLVTLHRGELFLHALRDTTIKTRLAIVSVKKNALLSIAVTPDAIRVIACSGPMDVTITTGTRTIPLAVAEEAVISDHVLSRDECYRPDGIGRRDTDQYPLGDGLTLTISEVSLTSFLATAQHIKPLRQARTPSNKSTAFRLIKTAAALQQLTQHKGSYTARQRPSSTHQPNLVPVGYRP